MDCRLRGRSHLREARRALLRVACAMTRASACGSSWLSVESRRVALATIATPSRADAPRRRPVAAVRHAIAAEAPATHWAGRQKARAALASATRLMSESDRASFAAYDVEFVVEISLSPGCQAVRCCQVICRAVGQLSGTVRCLCQTSCQVLSVLSGAVGCVSDRRGDL